ncbi:response regulator [Paenibacillus sp. FSL R10-2734]|uniref:response regulator n=1 Tax=Paenibacillus sp. FSL R10-2734 TaxID=2954691 RepID=UPI0030D7473F
MHSVLVVDDEKWIRRGLIQTINWDAFGLKFAGEAANGDDAFTLAMEIRPDLMFLDMLIPGMDGRALLAKLKEVLPNIKVIVISGYSDFENTKEAIRHHVLDYLLKPVRKEELNAVLGKVCEEIRSIKEKKESSLLAQDGWFRNTNFKIQKL